MVGNVMIQAGEIDATGETHDGEYNAMHRRDEYDWDAW